MIFAHRRRIYPRCCARESWWAVHVAELEIAVVLFLWLWLYRVDLDDELAAVRARFPAHAAELRRAQECDGVHRERGR